MRKKKQDTVIKFNVAFSIPLATLDAMAARIARKASLADVGCATLGDEDRITWQVCRAGAAAARKPCSACESTDGERKSAAIPPGWYWQCYACGHETWPTGERRRK